MLSLVLILTALLCGLVAGFLFAFAVVVMPGIRMLGDREFLRAFQAIDGVIQRGQPLFGIVWLGSVVAAAATLIVGLGSLVGPGRLLLAVAGSVYLLGVQLPTIVVNIPLNNRIQGIDLDAASDSECRTARRDFESRWNRWNRTRTLLAGVTLLLVLVVIESR